MSSGTDSKDTALDLEAYEIAHPADPERRQLTYAAYASAMNRHGIFTGSCLEIGSGTGNLTDGLVNTSGFREVHCSDISPRFLTRLRHFLKDSPKLRYWMFDAGSLPFKDGSMDAVFGHSVLHHILYYEKALEDVHRVLRPGGLAMFGDPIMDCHAITGFCAGIILMLENQFGLANLTGREKEILSAIRSQGPTISRRMRHAREELNNIEDKHIYVISDMLKLGKELGFDICEFENAFNPTRVGDDHKFRINQTMQFYGMPEGKLRAYDFIWDEMTATYGQAMGGSAPANFGYFIFRK